MLMSDRTSGLLRATAVSGLVTLMLVAVSLAADSSGFTAFSSLGVIFVEFR